MNVGEGGRGRDEERASNICWKRWRLGEAAQFDYAPFECWYLNTMRSARYPPTPVCGAILFTGSHILHI